MMAGENTKCTGFVFVFCLFALTPAESLSGGGFYRVPVNHYGELNNLILAPGEGSTDINWSGLFVLPELVYSFLGL